MLKRAFLKILKLFFCILLIGVSFVLMNQYQPQFLKFIIDQVHAYGLFFRLFRWSIILSVLLFWPFLIKKLSGVSEEYIAFWLSKRWQIAAWFILFELLVCENLVFKLTQLLV